MLPLLIGLVIVIFLRGLGNALNRTINVLWFGADDHASNALNCTFLIFVVLMILLRLRPRHFACYGLALVHAELLMQLAYLCMNLNLQYLIVCDLIATLQGTWLGSLLVYQVLLVLFILYMVFYHILGNISINWDNAGDDDCCDAGCDVSKPPVKGP
ncbi:Hypothetical predicted protein, partial [Olea europaea subsp. europaea]